MGFAQLFNGLRPPINGVRGANPDNYAALRADKTKTKSKNKKLFR
jgi:hypothetical protein